MAISLTTLIGEGASRGTSVDQPPRQYPTSAAVIRRRAFLIWLAVMTTFIAFVMISSVLFPEWSIPAVHIICEATG